MSPAEEVAASKGKLFQPKPIKSNPWICHAKAHRKALGLTQEDVCKHVGIAIASYSQIERGHAPTMLTAVRIARFFGKTLSEVWEIVPDPVEVAG